VIICSDLGIVPYEKALNWQKRLAELRRRDAVADHLLLLEHPPVYTMGRRDSGADLRIDAKMLRNDGLAVVKTDRGGRMTYHGPGQLVGYLIFRLNDPIPKLVWKIEECLLRTLSRFQLNAERDPEHPGLWVDGERKIAALGLRIERGVTTHGFALNVTCDLSPFAKIHPCGIKDRGVTSMEREMGWSPSLREVKQAVLEEFARVFQSNVSVEGIFSNLPE
jgi:lipoyl(octanoyl) transferase